jgi:uncharacterized oxidoreductase
MKLSGNTVLVTGGATGIGLALAEQFLKAGSEVIICGRRENRLLEAQKKYPKMHIRVCDVAKTADRTTLLEWVRSGFPALNILINNAGIQRDIDFKKGIDGYLAGQSEIAVNLEAPIVLTGMFVPFLTGKPGAAIINVSSGLGFVPAANMPVYSATKAGLHAFSMAIRHQLRSTGIKVIEVIPPAVDTELNQEGRALRGGYKPDTKSEEFAAVVMKGIAGDAPEIGYGMTENSIKASRADLDKAFQQMNSRW